MKFRTSAQVNTKTISAAIVSTYSKVKVWGIGVSVCLVGFYTLSPLKKGYSVFKKNVVLSFEIVFYVMFLT